jgi:voltage-gated potassium channel
MTPPESPEKQALNNERLQVLEQLEQWLEAPLLALGFLWLVLLVVEFIGGLSALLQNVVTLVWIIFIIDFALRFLLAPRKLAYLRKNWLTAISLLLPALRLVRVFWMLRILRLARTARTLQLVRILGSLNRGMRSLGATMDRRGVRYVLGLTLIVIVVGSAGVYNFERATLAGREALPNYGTALWWTAMLMTTSGSEYWPQTAEGRILTFILALYAVGMLGYITAILATFFIGRDAESEEAELAGSRSIEALRAEIAALRAELQLQTNRSPGSSTR